MPGRSGAFKLEGFMRLLKVRAVTSLKKLREYHACESGMATLLKYLPKNQSETKEINLLQVLKSNGIDHFFWAWRASKIPKKIKRMVLHDIVKLVQPIYEKQYSQSNVFKQVLKALQTGRHLLEATNTAYAATAYADDVYAAAYAAYAAAYATTYAADVYAADAAAYAADAAGQEMKEKQIQIIKKYFK